MSDNPEAVRRLVEANRQRLEASVRRGEAELEATINAIVNAGGCICMEIVDGVVQVSNTFVHPHCPRHGDVKHVDWRGRFTYEGD